jgi:hypothetical protein
MIMPSGSATEGHVVFLVRSTGHAFHLEKVLGLVGIACKLIPVPRHLSSDCGVCVRIEGIQKEASLAAIEKYKVEVEAIHEV